MLRHLKSKNELDLKEQDRYNDQVLLFFARYGQDTAQKYWRKKEPQLQPNLFLKAQPDEKKQQCEKIGCSDDCNGACCVR